MSPEVDLINLAAKVRQGDMQLAGWEIILNKIKSRYNICCRRNNNPNGPQIFFNFAEDDEVSSLLIFNFTEDGEVFSLQNVSVTCWDGPVLEDIVFNPDGQRKPASVQRPNGNSQSTFEPIARAAIAEFYQLIQQTS